MKTVNIGIIGGGLMGKEIASAFARWCSLEDVSVQPILKAVCDLNPTALEWFKKIPSVTQSTPDIEDILSNPEIDVLYVALPHHLHEEIYNRVLRSGKDLLAEKPFGIGLNAARSIAKTAKETGRFVRCSSEFPFYPGPQHALKFLANANIGRVLEAQFGFHHSSDLDASKPGNWKRRSESCGEIGVMADLGMHATHIPLRLGWLPQKVYGQLQKGFPIRGDGKGGEFPCDTYDNAVLHTWIHVDSNAFPLRLEMKRLAPGQTNTWFFQVLGDKAGVRYSSSEPKTIWTYKVESSYQKWERLDLGFQTAFPTVTGGIFEAGFPDTIQQMWAAFLEERNGTLGDRFGCVTPDEAVNSHCIFDAALTSHQTDQVQPIEK